VSCVVRATANCWGRQERLVVEGASTGACLSESLTYLIIKSQLEYKYYLLWNKQTVPWLLWSSLNYLPT
jgi:ABC-type enterobactin transport system permease subunit